MSPIKKFFKWLFKNDYGLDVYPYDDDAGWNKPCDVPEEPYMIGTDLAPMPTIEEQDHEFYELTDPKGCRIEIYKDRKKEWHWRFFSANNKILAVSGEGYKRKGSMRKSLNMVREVMPFAPVEEE